VKLLADAEAATTFDPRKAGELFVDARVDARGFNIGAAAADLQRYTKYATAAERRAKPAPVPPPDAIRSASEDPAAIPLAALSEDFDRVTATPKAALTRASLAVAEPVGATLEAFIRAATLAFPEACSESLAAVDTRDARVAGGEPTSVVPFTSAPVLAAASRAAAVNAAAAADTLEPPEAFFTASAVALAGLAA